MICKWCGAELTDTAGTCSRCGREVPAKSDCGGFYDMVFLPKGPAPVKQEPVPAKRETVPDAGRSETRSQTVPAGGRKKRRHRGSLLWLPVMCIGFAVVFALLLSQDSKRKETKEMLAQANERINLLEAQMAKLTAGEEIAQREVSLDLDLEKGKVTAQPKDLADGLTQKVTTEADTTTARIGFGEDKDCVTVALRQEDASVSAVFTVDKAVFGKAEGDARYEWRWRPAGEKKWSKPDKAALEISENGSAVTLVAAGEAELELVYTRENTEEGSLSVTVSGIRVTKQTSETNTQEEKNHG